MLEQIKHLFNNVAQSRLIMFGGLPGSGKSTIVAEFEKAGYKVVCPDQIRHKLAQREEGCEGKYESQLDGKLQKYSILAFKLAEKDIKKYIEAGESVVFDATNLNVKSRKQVLGWGRNNKIPVIAVYIECPVDLALERNIRRSRTVVAVDHDDKEIYGRYVPGYVIELKAQSQVLPTVKEGFKEVYILHAYENLTVLEDANEKIKLLYTDEDIEKTLTEWHNKDLFKIMLPTFGKCWGIDQQNSHHIYPLHIHMINAAKHLQKESFPLFLATLIHDVGKLATKRQYGKMLVDTEQFKVGEKVEVKVGENGYVSCRVLNYKGERVELLTIKHVEVDPDFHYYNHNIVGAIIARRELSYLGFDEDVLNQCYEYILYHMDMPFKTPYTEKAAEKLINKVGEDNAMAMLKLREADKLASGNGADYLDGVHKHNIEIFKSIIDNRKVVDFNEKNC